MPSLQPTHLQPQQLSDKLLFYLPTSDSPRHSALPTTVLLIAVCGWLPCKLSDDGYGRDLLGKAVKGLMAALPHLKREDIITMTFLSGGSTVERLSSLANPHLTDETSFTLQANLRVVSEVYFVSHSQGVPFSFGLAAKSIEKGWIGPQHRLGFVNLAGAMHGTIEPVQWSRSLLGKLALFSGGSELLHLGDEHSEQSGEVERNVKTVMMRKPKIVNFHGFGDAQVGLYSSSSSLTYGPRTLVGLVYQASLDNIDPVLSLQRFFALASNLGYNAWPRGLPYVLREVHGWAGVDLWARCGGLGQKPMQRGYLGAGHCDVYAGWAHLSEAFRYITGEDDPAIAADPDSPPSSTLNLPKRRFTPLQTFLYQAFTDAAIALKQQTSSEVARIQVDIQMGAGAFGINRWKRMEGLLTELKF